jgi:Sulfotransferase family
MSHIHPLPRYCRKVPPDELYPAPFVVGAPRSGTTLLRLMLDAHPALAIPPETHFFPIVSEAVAGTRRPAKAFRRAVVQSPRWGDLGLSAAALDAELDRIDPFDLGDALRAVYRLYAKRFNKPRWGDKTPAHLVHMSEIAAVLPEARFVHIIRDGRDVACSIVERSFGPVSLEAAAGWWRRQILTARAQARELPRYMELRYEDLVADPEPTLRAVCAHIELPYEPVMLDYHQGARQRMAEIAREGLDPTGRILLRAFERQAMNELATEPPRTDTSHWRERLTPHEVEHFENVTGDLLAQLGYPVGTERG